MEFKVFPRRLLFLILIGAFVVEAFSQQPSPTQVTPSAEKLRQHISYLASDALEGRRTGSAGANNAAHYLAGEFSRLELRPPTQSGRGNKPSQLLSKFLQIFPYLAGVELGKTNKLSFKSSASGPSVLGV